MSTPSPARRRLNPRLAKRPRFRGLPVPYVQFLRTDGSPDFRVIDDRKKRRAIDRHWCGLCGEPLDALMALVGGPLCVTNRTWGEPAFHLACAQDAMQLCPYLCRGKDHFHGQLPTAKVDEDYLLVTDPHSSDQRPERIAIYVTRSYTYDGQYVRSGPPVRIEWYDPAGRRIEIAQQRRESQ